MKSLDRQDWADVKTEDRLHTQTVLQNYLPEQSRASTDNRFFCMSRLKTGYTNRQFCRITVLNNRETVQTTVFLLNSLNN